MIVTAARATWGRRIPRPSALGARVLWIVAAALPLLASDLGRRILATNDEARFAVLAQGVLARNDWLHPMLNGSPYYNKPPLQIWLIVAASWPAGDVTQFTAVVPSAGARWRRHSSCGRSGASSSVPMQAARPH